MCKRREREEGGGGGGGGGGDRGVVGGGGGGEGRIADAWEENYCMILIVVPKKILTSLKSETLH